jgi:hypothetical protein
MKRAILPAVFLMTLLLIQAMPAHASTFVTFVASTGSNSNNCSTPALACRNISTALANTQGNGLITCVDSANYNEGTVTITIGVTIDCQHLGDMPTLVVNGSGITVSVRNYDVFVDGVPCITFQQGTALIVENMTCRDNPNGILFSPTNSKALLVVHNSLFHSNQSGSSGAGINISANSPASVIAQLDGVRVENNWDGVFLQTAAGSSINLTMTGGYVSGNASNGFAADGIAGQIFATIQDSSFHGNLAGAGVAAEGSGAFVFVSRSTITGNNVGWTFGSGGSLISYGNNAVDLNTTDGSPSATTPLQ